MQFIVSGVIRSVWFISHHLLESYGYDVFLPQRDGYLAAELKGKSHEELTDMIFKKDLEEVLKADILFILLEDLKQYLAKNKL